MSEYVPFIIFGLSVGSVYGLSAMGLVLTYRTSGLFNLAQGAVAAAGAFAFYDFRDLHGMSWPVAALLTLLVFGVLLGVILERMSNVLRDVTTAQKIVATIGLLIAIRAIAVLRYGIEALTFEPFLPTGDAFTVTGIPVSWDRLILLGLGTVCAAGLYLFFTRSRLGTSMRAVVDDQQLLDMTGINPYRVRLAAWVIGSCFACASGVMLAELQNQIDVDILSVLVIQAFGAAAIGRFSSLPITFAGGLGLGILQGLTSKEISGHANLSGIDVNMPFIVLFVILVFSNRKRLVEVGREVKGRAVPASRLPMPARAGGYATLLVLALLVPQLVGTKLVFYNSAVSSVVLFLSLSLLVRTSGQISLCHVGFAAIGAATFAHMLGHGVPWGLAVLIGGLVVVPVGALIAVPAIRLSGLFLGLATLGFGILLAQYAYGKDYMIGPGISTRRPAGFDDDKKYYYLLLGIALIAVAVVVLIERTRMGRLLRGMADSPIALTTLGTNVKISRVIVFCVAAFLAGVSGATTAGLFGSITPDTFKSVNSMSILAILAISGRRTVPSAVVAAWLFAVFPAYLKTEKATLYSYVAFGVAAIFVAATSQGSLDRWARTVRARYRESRPAAGSGAHRSRLPADGPESPPAASDLPVTDGPSETASLEEATAGTAVTSHRSATHRHDEGV
jgi:branched-subunit amino acid ABC-type transport system permease component